MILSFRIICPSDAEFSWYDPYNDDEKPQANANLNSHIRAIVHWNEILWFLLWPWLVNCFISIGKSKSE